MYINYLTCHLNPGHQHSLTRNIFYYWIFECQKSDWATVIFGECYPKHNLFSKASGVGEEGDNFQQNPNYWKHQNRLLMKSNIPTATHSTLSIQQPSLLHPSVTEHRQTVTHTFASCVVCLWSSGECRCEQTVCLPVKSLWVVYKLPPTQVGLQTAITRSSANTSVACLWLRTDSRVFVWAIKTIISEVTEMTIVHTESCHLASHIVTSTHG